MKKYLKKFWLVFALMVQWPVSSQAQSTSNEQLWVEYMINYPFANSFNLENAFTYSTLLGSRTWSAFDFSPTLEYSLTQNIDFTIGGTLSYTVQTDSYNTFEVRPVIGSRVYLTPNRRIQIRIYARLEDRNFKNLETGEWEHVTRPRARFEVLYPMNRKSMHEDKLLYTIFDAEWLFDTGDEVDEVFANRLRLRSGLGYRVSYSSRFEIIYMNQQSRGGVDEDFASNDNIFRLRYKHFLRKKKPTTMSGTGN